MLVKILIVILFIESTPGADWPQLQRDAARSGLTADRVEPPFRARWVWFGSSARTLRNRRSEAAWGDDLDSRNGYSYPDVPAAVDLTLADPVQPVLVEGRLFVGSQEGQAYAVAAADGATAWQTQLGDGTAVSAAVLGEVVCFALLGGEVVALDRANGTRRWSHDCGRAITGAPLVAGGLVVVADHGGGVTALDAAGRRVWRAQLPAPVLGGLCADADSVYVGAEDLRLHALRLADGALRASSPQLRGQSFRMLHPVAAAGRIWAHTVTTPVIGSEYVMESLMASASSLSDEEARITRWLQGDTDGGAWPDASPDWQHVFPLAPGDLAQTVTVLAGPVDGCGIPGSPVCLDHRGRVLTYFKTRFPTLTAASAFGTAYSIDIAGVDLATGRRVPIDHGHLSGVWPWETDNLFALSVAGGHLWLRQGFRGTLWIDLETAIARGVSACVRHRDGGEFHFDVVYRDTAASGTGIATPSVSLRGRAAPIVVGARAYIAENFGLTCIEHHQP